MCSTLRLLKTDYNGKINFHNVQSNRNYYRYSMSDFTVPSLAMYCRHPPHLVTACASDSAVVRITNFHTIIIINHIVIR